MSDEIKRQYVNYLFFKADAAWRQLSREERDRGRSEFEGVGKDWKGRALIIPFTTVGTRADTDFVLWRISERLEDFTEMSTQLLNTGFGKWCLTPYSYLGMTKRSMYVDHHEHEGSEGRRGRVVPGQNKYIFIYPFWKTRAWYLLPAEERQRLMNEHIRVGHLYPRVKLNTTYSFGIDDQEFVVAFETNYPEDFLDLVQQLRETEISPYTLKDTPIFTCIRMTPEDMLARLG